MKPVPEVPSVSDPACRQRFREWNDTRRAFHDPGEGGPCLHQLVAAQAARTPGRVAVSCGGEELTYRELLDRARALAGRLRALGAGPEVRIGICAERSLEMVVGLLGILETGAAYVPLDPSYPAERLGYMLEHSGAPVLLLQERLAGILPPHRARVVLLDGAAGPEACSPGHGPLPPLPVPLLPDSLVYVMYTSGSTGRPKGVMNGHRAVCNRLLWQREDFGFHEGDRVLQKTPFSFDISVWELFLPLITGARLVMARPGGHGDPAYLVDVMERESITVAHFVASMMRAFLGAPGLERCARTLRCVVNGGEALPAEVEKLFFERFGASGEGPRLYNLYGPTEAAIEATWWPCEPGEKVSVPIGRPIANVAIHILDGDFQPVAPGEAAELYIGGVAPARGYHDRPDLTAASFLPDPLSEEPGARIYRTGDLARFRPDGVIEYLGRIDFQIKIHGFRIELGEIEMALAAHPAVRTAVVTAYERGGEPRLAAYVVPAEPVSPQELRAFAAARVPDYMVPADFVFLDALPLTPSGKLDRKSLPEPRQQAGREHVPPRTPLERYLAGLWGEVLGIEGPGLHDSFFDLGGTSISAAVVANRLQSETGEILHAVALFDAPTLGELAAYLGREHRQAVARVWGAESLPDGGVEAAGTDARVDEVRIEELRRLVDPLPPLAFPEPKNPPAVFVLAPPRSGTTLLRVMLGGHPGLFSPPELELLSFNTMAERRDAFPGRDSFWLEGVIRAVLELQGGELEEARALVEACEREGWTTRRFYRRLQEWIGGRLLVDKSTSYPLDPEVLKRAEEAFESPFYVHLLRHPYGMIHSFEEARIDQLFFRRPHPFSRRELAELVWVVSHRNIAAFLAGIPRERRHRLRFENLVRDPEGELRRLCSALGIEYHPDMADPYKEKRARMTDGLHAEGRMLGDMKFHEHRGVEAGAAERWRAVYTEDFLGEPTWETAAALGYERRRRPLPLQAVPRRPGEPAPLSPAQERLWFLDRLVPGSSAYNAAREVRLRGPLEPAVLALALGGIVHRHEVLRSVFRQGEDGPVQTARQLPPSAGLSLPVIDLGGLPEGRKRAEAERLTAETARLPYDLERDLLLRGTLVRLAPEEHALLFQIHHIATDGWSMDVLRRELEALCRGLPLPPLPLQYADYAVWQRAWLAGEEPAAQLAAWRRRLAGLPPALELPTDRPRPSVQSLRGAVERVEISLAAAGALEGLARRSGATFFMALLGVFQTLLHRVTGQEDLAVGIPVANRNRPELEGLIGFFVNNLVLRADFASDPTFAGVLERTREAALFAYLHQDLPFERLVAELTPGRDLAHSPLVQVMLSFQEDPPAMLDLGGGLHGELREIHNGASKFDLWLQVSRQEGGWTAKIEYATDLFEAGTVQRLLRGFRALLEGAVADPGARVSGLPLLDGREREQVLADGNRTEAAIPDEPVHRLFERQARRAPDALAVETLTYGELDRRAGRLAADLRRRGVGPEVLVALVLERSPELVTAALAVLKAGGAYLPIDPAHPAERVLHMVADSGAHVVVTAADLTPIPEVGPVPEMETDPDGLAYVIYTSGSTGLPKGTELRHRGLSNLCAWHLRTYGLGPDDRAALLAGPGFDASVWEMWPALAAGASLHVPPDDVVRNPPALLEWMAERRITVTFLPTPLADAVLAEPMPAGLALRAVLTGGDRLRRRPPAGLPFELVNHYGPTESTVVATAGRVGTEGDRAPDIGSAIANTRVHVLDRFLQLLPAGFPGELCIAGEGLARGYRGRPETTAERFVPDPYGPPGSRLYRTGDLVRRVEGGRLEFLGRLDRQVKIRGHRIELGEIEAALARLPGVREAAVLAREGRLVAYLAPRTLVVEEIRQALGRTLPDSMIPGAWVLLDGLPLTPNGKLDRAALARVEPEGEETPREALPGTPLEELLAGLFAQVLGLDRAVGLHEDFFHTGGHSLLAARLAARTREVCGVDPGVRGVFEAPTVARLAERIEAAARQEWPDEPARGPIPREGDLPLSFAQRRLWFLEALRPGTALYNLTRSYELRGELSVPALAAALGEVVRRHEALRTTFVPSEDGEPIQAVAPPEAGPFPLPVVDVAGPEGAGVLEAEEARRPYDLRRGPLLRATLLRLGEREHRLLLGLHHIVADGLSLEVLREEVSILYRAFAAGRSSPLPPLPVQYPDFAVWQRRRLAGGIVEEQLAWWRERLAGAPAALEIPADRPRPAVPSLRGAVERTALGPDLEAGLARLGRRHGATLFMVLLAGFQALLHRYTGQDDLVVGSPVAGRDRRELERLIGFFVNMVALRGDLSRDPGLAALLAATRESALGAYAHQDLPFERLVEELAPERDLSRAPVFQAVLALQEAPAGPDLGEGIAASAAPVHAGVAKFDLTLLLERGPGGLEALAEYAAGLFDAGTVRRLLGHFRNLLAGAVANPETPVSELPLLGPEERRQALLSGGGMAAEVPPVPVHVLFEEWADRTPEALAVADGDRRLTYGELERRANRLAHRLRGLGVGPESVVAVVLERSPELVIAALGTLKAGGAWLPLDPAYPAERVRHAVRDSGAAVVLSGPGDLEGEDEERPAVPDLGPDLLAYVIYTSGSTGTPKGTELRHGGLANLVAWHRRTYGTGPGDRSPLLAGPGFDASVWEMWPALASGASLHVPPREVLLSPARLLGWLADEGITAAFLPTPLAEAVLPEPLPEGLALRTLLTGGDRLHRRPAPGLPFALVNHYGPTESTVVATAGGVESQGDRLPDIGRPIANTAAHVLDRSLRPLPDGVPGELCVGGEGLARGYRGRPETTAERFVPNPYGPPGSRLYRTGDLVRRLPDGNLDFLGRIDHQVKIRGFRIELGEIESVLAACPGVAAAAVLLNGGRLTAYVVGTARAPELHAALALRLPEAMIPSAWAFPGEMPLTANGKVDRKALERIAPEEAPRTDAARTPTEEILGGLFAEVLGLDAAAGPDGDFFHLGGHSLMVVQLVSRVRNAFAVDLDVRTVFERPTVAGLARWIEAAALGGLLTAPPVVPERRGGEAPLSFAQQRLWFLDRFEAGGTPLYNVPVVFRIRGEGLSVPALATALGEVVRRHEALRTVFHEGEDGEPVQIVQPFAPFGLPVVDLSETPETAEGIEREVAERPFDLGRGPLLRVLLLRLGPAEHRLIVSTHHIVSDGWSMGILVREVSRAYQGLPLSPLPVQYADFALWQRRVLSGEVLETELAGWRERLAGIPAGLELPTDRPRPAAQSFQGDVRRAELPAQTVEGLAALSRRQGATLFMTALAAFQALLHRWTGEEDLVVGTPVAGRNRVEIEGLIGFFVNTLALRTSLAGDPGFGELVARTRTAALEAYAHQDVPFERLVAEAAPRRDLSRPPIFQVLMSLQEARPEGLDLGPGLTAPLSEIRTATSKFDFSLHLIRDGAGLRASAEHAAALFDAATVDRLLGHFGVLLAGAVADPRTPVPDLPLMTEAERRQLASWDVEAARSYPGGGTLHGLFEAQAARTPGAPALVWEGKVLTYAELEARSARLARRLRRLGAGPEVPVGICLPRTPDLIVSLLAVLRAGAFYVPLDPAYPPERLAYLLEDSGCGLVVTHESVESSLPPTSARLLRLDGDEDAEAEPAAVLAGNLAYLIYTSGSTGRPKAVAIEHRSAVLLAHWARDVFSPEDFAGMLASTSITFDMSVFEIFATLAWGGTLILVDNALSLASLKTLPDGIEVRVLDTVPSAAAELLRMDGLPASVRTLNLGGEAVPRPLADRAYGRPETERLYNLYGPSEDTTFSTIALIERQSERAPSIGWPLDGTRAWVLDRRLELVPIGVPGELYLAGGGLSRGYLGRPELTAERYLPDPFGGPGERMYRTGDLVRRRADGELEYLGRLDHQVKIRGFRVELGEIEATLAACPGVKDAVVVAWEGERLVAYVAGSADPAALRQAVQSRLPGHMTPSAFVLLEDLPRTPNGKVDRRALPPPADTRPEPASDLPQGPLEQALAGLWSELLGIGEIGRHDSFFELGGHSLLVARFISRMRETFGVELPLRAIFEGPTVAEAAAAVEALLRERSGQEKPDRITPGDLRTAPLSYAQQRLWFLDRLQPGTAVYNLPVVFRVEGPLDPGALAAALSEIERRHAALRTRFELDADRGEPVQVVAPPAPHLLARADLSGLPGPRREAEAARLLAEEQRRPFDLARGPLLRSLLVRLSPEDHRLVLTLHHIVSDGWSVGVLLRELAALCGGATLPDLPVQYADFAVWQRRWLEGGEMEAQLGGWRRHLAGEPPVLELPADRPRPPVPSLRGGTERLALGPELSAAVEVLGHRRGTTLFMTLLAAFQALLYRYTGQEDLWVGTPVAGRNRAEVEDLIGFFVNTLVLRTDLGGGPAFGELLDRTRETVLAAQARQDVPFETLVEALAPERDLASSPLVQVSFSAQGEPAAVRTLLAPGVALVPLPADTGTAKLDLSMGLWKEPGGTFTAGAEYALDLFDPATVKRLLGHFAVLLEGALRDPEISIADLPLMADGEIAQLRAAWSGGDPILAATPTLHGLVELQARRAPGAAAVVHESGRLTYGELQERASRLAGRLRALGVGPETRVALCAGRTPEMVVGFLGILQAGGACVPLDPDHPQDRLAFVLADAGAAALVTTEELAPRLPSSLPRVMVTGDGPGIDTPTPVLPESLAYVIYTSGSTGRPKGVAVAHREAAGHCAAVARLYGLNPEDRILQFASPAFDVAVEEIFPTLAAGAALVLRGARPWDTAEISQRVAALGLTVLNLPSAVWQHWVGETGPRTPPPPSLRLVVAGSEEVLAEPARRWLGTPFAAVRLLNGYGPTEAVVTATLHEVAAGGLGHGASVPIGRPLPGRSARVLDARGNPVPAGVPGELCLGGCLARGYLGRPDLTAESFVPDPFGEPGARQYRTGDRVRLLPDGSALEFLGRVDEQVKVRGFRIEPAEIEAALAAHPQVAAAVAGVRGTGGERRLVAWVETRGENPPAASELRRALRESLPEYMVPTSFVFLAAFPLSPSGKVDRRALPEPERGCSGVAGEGDFLAPRTPLEEQIAGIWQEVLRIDRVGVHDNFWDLGGHSLLATKVLARVNGELGLDLPLQALFLAPALGDFATAAGEAFLATCGGGIEDALAELDGLAEEEIRALLAETASADP